MYRIIKIGMDVHSKNYTLCAMEETVQIAIFRGQQGRISRPDRAILNGQF